jgi:hypothetical protein
VNARSPNLLDAADAGRARERARGGGARRLLEAGADTRARNDWGDSALTMAMRYEHLHGLAKMISSPEEFAIAAKAPKESFGAAVSALLVAHLAQRIWRRTRSCSVSLPWAPAPMPR